jgi:hypothetical protein
MGLFQKTEETAIISVNGLFRQCEVYTWDGWLFAKYPGGYIRLHADGSTSKPNVTIRQLHWNGPLSKDTFGRLAKPEVPNTKLLDGSLPMLEGDKE